MEEALSDPKFQALQAKASELAELHARIEELEATSSPGLSTEDRALLDEYADILSSLGTIPPYAPAPKPQTASENKPKPQVSTTTVSNQKSAWEVNLMSLDDLMKAYHDKVDEMNRSLAEMAPPPEFTPEQQRDYYAARKIATKEFVYDMEGYSPTVWVCNYCGCHHSSPPECTRPELGGTWIYVSPEEYQAENACVIGTKLSIS